MRRYISRLAAMAVIITVTVSGCGMPSTGDYAYDISGDVSDNALSEVVCGVSAEAPEESPITRKGDYLECNFYDRGTFRRLDEISEPYEIGGKLTAGVVTHHLLAGRMIASFFKAASENREDIETVVIIAPNHYPNDSPHDLITTRTGWQTDFGEVECDREISEKFTTELGAAEDDEMMTKDHAASTFLPFIGYYLPEAKVSCLLISARADRGLPEKTAELLYDISREKSCLFLFSADFSHYLEPDIARQRDSESLEAIMSGDVRTIELMNDDHMDTPRGICTFIHLMNLQSGEITALDRSDSAEQAGVPYTRGNFPEGVTSYLILSGETEKQPHETE